MFIYNVLPVIFLPNGQYGEFSDPCFGMNIVYLTHIYYAIKVKILCQHLR